MKLPAIHGIIDRRILVNFTADATITSRIIPAPFRPKLYNGKAIVGICLIRLKQIRPKGLPGFIGISSENGAHRIAVEWEEGRELKEGVYIPRRDTSSKWNAWAGGRLFPGKHHLAKFEVTENNGYYHIAFTSDDATRLLVEAKESTVFPANSIFGSLQNASSFFEKGATGYSPLENKYQGLQLQTHHWQVQPLKISEAWSDFFNDQNGFPRGSLHFDNALLMKQVTHEWKTMPDKKYVPDH